MAFSVSCCKMSAFDLNPSFTSPERSSAYWAATNLWSPKHLQAPCQMHHATPVGDRPPNLWYLFIYFSLFWWFAKKPFCFIRQVYPFSTCRSSETIQPALHDTSGEKEKPAHRSSSFRPYGTKLSCQRLFKVAGRRICWPSGDWPLKASGWIWVQMFSSRIFSTFRACEQHLAELYVVVCGAPHTSILKKHCSPSPMQNSIMLNSLPWIQNSNKKELAGA